MPDPVPPDPAAGVFETLLVAAGRPVELEAHMRRLESSTLELYGAPPPPDARELALGHALPLALGRLRLTLTPSPAGGLDADVVTAAVERASVFPSWERAVELRRFELPGGLGAHKWADRRWLAELEAAVGAGALPLLAEEGGEVLEASRANVFALDGGALVTPPADGRILPGVARSRAIELARELGVEVRERELTVQQLAAASEAFATGSVRGVEPVRAVEGSELAGPGEVTREIAAAMERRWLAAAAG